MTGLIACFESLARRPSPSWDYATVLLRKEWKQLDTENCKTPPFTESPGREMTRERRLAELCISVVPQNTTSKHSICQTIV
jgi:hypothetical protein